MKKIVKFIAVCILLLGINYIQQNHYIFSQETADKYIQDADDLASTKDIQNIEKAIEEYKNALKIDPGNNNALYKIANAYVVILDLKTYGLVIEKDEYKPILKEIGGIAVEYAKKAYEINPKSKHIIRAYLASYAYFASSMGIVKAILKGAGGLYKDLANELILVDDEYWDAYGYSSLGRFYYEAPWPAGSKKKAKLYLEKACKKGKDALYAHYWLGMTYLRYKDYELARKEFEFVINQKPSSLEAHYISEFKKQAAQQISSIENK